MISAALDAIGPYLILCPILGFAAFVVVALCFGTGGWRKAWSSLVGLLLTAIHLIISVKVQNGPADGSWTWFPMFLVDFPASLVPLFAGAFIDPLPAFGVVGTLWWYLVGSSFQQLFRR